MAGGGTSAQQRSAPRARRQGARLFAAHGYAAVGLAEIVRAAGVTKGALYHHFDSKADLFRAVLQRGAGGGRRACGRGGRRRRRIPGTQLTAGCRAFLVASTTPEVQQIMLVDGPAVLGWTQWRALDEAASGRHLAEALDRADRRRDRSPRSRSRR